MWRVYASQQVQGSVVTLYGFPQLRHDATDRLSAYFHLWFSKEDGFFMTSASTDLIYAHTNDASRIRQLLVDAYHCQIYTYG
jgi:hypothetical protein